MPGTAAWRRSRTSISTTWTGSAPTIPAIAREKAAIIERGDRAVTGATGEALAIIRRRARAARRSAHEVAAGAAPRLGSRRDRSSSCPASGRRGSACAAGTRPPTSRSPTRCSTRSRRPGSRAWPDDARRRGYATARWPGRLELLDASTAATSCSTAPTTRPAPRRSRPRSTTCGRSSRPTGAARRSLHRVDGRQGRGRRRPPRSLAPRSLRGARIICTDLGPDRSLPAGELAACGRRHSPHRGRWPGRPRRVHSKRRSWRRRDRSSWPARCISSGQFERVSSTTQIFAIRRIPEPDDRQAGPLSARRGTCAPGIRRGSDTVLCIGRWGRRDPAGARCHADRPADVRVGQPARSSWGSSTSRRIRSRATDCCLGRGLGRAASGNGPRRRRRHVQAALAVARRMVAEGADLLDVGGESTRPGHAPVDAAEERRRVVPVVARAPRRAARTSPSASTRRSPPWPRPRSTPARTSSTTSGASARTTRSPGSRRSAAVPIVLMHNRAEPRYTNLIAEVVADLQRRDRAGARGRRRWDDLIVDPGFGFGKTPDHNLALLARPRRRCASWAGRSCSGRRASRRSARCSTCPPTSASRRRSRRRRSAIAAGVDIVRVHDVRAERPRRPDEPTRSSASGTGQGDAHERPHRARTT